MAEWFFRSIEDFNSFYLSWLSGSLVPDFNSFYLSWLSGSLVPYKILIVLPVMAEWLFSSIEDFNRFFLSRQASFIRYFPYNSLLVMSICSFLLASASLHSDCIIC